MGVCLSATKVSGGSSSNSASHHRKEQRSSVEEKKINAGKDSQKPNNQKGHHHQQHLKSSVPPKNKQKPITRKQGGIIPWGKRTDFGYHKDFDKRYTIGKLLGHGQFGYTYVAIDKENGDRVAVKKIDKSKMIFPVAVEDVKREVKILEALKGHENMVQFYNAFEDDSYVYIVMELCEGGELLDRILAKKRQPL